MRRRWSFGLMAGLFGLVLDAQALAPSTALEFTSAVSPGTKSQMIADLNVLASFKARRSTPLFQKIFASDFTGSTVLRFFQARIHTVDMDDCGGGASSMACVARSNPQSMLLTENYTAADIPQIARLSILIHESRHSEVEYHSWSHVECPTPFLDPNGKDVVGLISREKMQGESACDRTVFGAYGVQIEFLKNTQINCENCSEKMKLDAGLFGDDLVNRIVEPKANQRLRQDVGLPRIFPLAL